MGLRTSRQAQKKTDAVPHLGVQNRVGLLIDGRPGMAGLPFIWSSDVGAVM